MAAYYNEIDPYAAQWLRNLIAGGHIADGEVDERSITDVSADDLLGFTQCHFFAGIGGWSLGARMAGWPDDKPLWTGSCPCQPFSVAGSQKGQADERHLWPVFFALIRARRPDVVMGEQVAAAVGKDWLDGVHSDLESIDYACGAAVVPACAVDAPHRRDRLWFVADAKGRGFRADRRTQEARRLGGFGYSDFSGEGPRGALANACPERCNGVDPLLREEERGRQSTSILKVAGSSKGDVANTDSIGQPRLAWAKEAQRNSMGSAAWRDAEWLRGADGKARRVESGIRLLAHGVPARVGKLRAYGNAIVPQVAAEVIGSYLDMERLAA